MNKLSIMTKSVAIAMSMVGMAHASNQWTGYYGGVNAGFTFNHVQLKAQQLGFANLAGTCNTSSNFSTAFAGMQLGYLYQFPNNLASGIEANVTFNDHQNDTLSCNNDINPNIYDGFTLKNQLQTVIKGRMGYPLNWHENILLPYVTMGASFADVDLKYKNEASDYYSKSDTQPGWLVGAGLEWMFMQQWSLRAEYYYIDYGTLNLNIPSVYGLIDPNGHAHVNLSSHNVVLIIDYWI